MKPIYSILLTFMFSISLYSQDKKEEPLRLKGVEMENDYHENITWIKSKPVSLVSKDFLVSAYDVTHIQIYFGMYMKDGKQHMTPIRLINKYRDSDWIFFDEVSYLLGSRKEVRAGQGKVFKITDKETNTEVSKGISEKSDVVTNEDAIAFIKYVLANETGLNIRYTSTRNSKYVELNVPDGTKKLQKHFKPLIEYYNLLSEKAGLNQRF
ncbi:hypothetical protein [Flavobacterium sp. 316]|uniref:hypothetical protein n=1 Tax=Flavobacterium sp. 316 TaxID=1603293 RepID=UPI000ACB85E2|nr:hypothetical protein [Flavobacterium sp. 316]